MWWFWLSLALGFFTLELATLRLKCVWVGVASLATMTVTLIFESISIPWQAAVFIALSLVLTISTAPLIEKIKTINKK